MQVKCCTRKGWAERRCLGRHRGMERQRVFKGCCLSAASLQARRWREYRKVFIWPHVNHRLIEPIAIPRRIPNTHLVMHGSSSVPQDLLRDIRAYGGDMKETYGVPVAEIQEPIKHRGSKKSNIDADIRLAITAAISKFCTKPQPL